MITKIAITAVCLIVALLILAATRSDTFRIQRSISIHASADKIFPFINDFHRWPDWAPQDREDPNMRRTFSGPERGIDAVSEWTGGGNTGQGHMTIVDSVAPAKVTVQTDFVKPFEAHNLNEFVLEPDGEFTRVTWSMQGSNPYFLKLIGIFVSPDKLMGSHFEAGLKNLKAKTEAP